MISRTRSRPLVEHTYAIDVRLLVHRGGPSGVTWCWGVAVRYTLDAARGELLLGFATETPIVVGLETTPCPFGGSRLWARCPTCAARVAILHRHGGTWQCRSCHGLAYASTRESPTRRLFRRARKVRAQLGGGGLVGQALPPRPPFMRRRTYERLTLQARAIEVGIFEQLDRR